ncbi:MAG: hypothetical protein A2420_05675 [Candidatus Moranbacteria bacterium RIFOXYC1_FULL_44_13]|nr:MAG: hypothetical protein A2184_01925 [Candidatus Moranbacteria bacterium RIFOXYA1_FULL_44_7]OGI33125.1 MAG: hypothetical protein A2420_05675 [Candidatus Moranbacteria bacterium RIFOXYC1_FULL_44_13]OGI38660.1 MAG: hypothetical protein A2612_00370 [Candidatus Moranbacteria bacterium RIFOXYD1_FULL_44_12]
MQKSKCKIRESLRDKLDIKKGFSILEVVATVFIFSIVTISIYGSFSGGLRSLAQSKHRIAATQLANEKMEVIRNLPYSQVGTESGVPSGSLLQEETVWRSNQKFNVRTTIVYVDDSLDGIEGGEPDDEIPLDYKEARVEVDWGSGGSTNNVVLVSRFVPDGVETDSGGGTLRLNVIDSTGEGVSGVSTHIVNNSTDPAIDLPEETDSSGSILLPGMPAADRTYEISVSKNEYESISTLPPYPTTSYAPTDIHGSVVEGALNSKVIILDKVGAINITTRDLNGNVVPNMNFNLEGGRILGLTMTSPKVSVFGYDQDVATDSGGNLSLSAMSPGNYTVSFVGPGYTLIGTEAPLFPFYLYPAQVLSVTLLVADNSVNSLIVTVKNSLSDDSVSGASVRLYNGDLSFDETLTTGTSGRVYFPPNEDPPLVMNAEQFTLEVSADGYEPFSGTIDVNQLVQTEVSLMPI